jgi:hypothetical protein
MVGGHRERVGRRDPQRDGVAHDCVDVPVGGDVLRLTVVGAERHPVRTELLHERDQRPEVAGGRGLADQQPEPRPQALPPLLQREGFMVGANAGGRVGLELAAEHARRVAVHVRRALDRELRQLRRVA